MIINTYCFRNGVPGIPSRPLPTGQHEISEANFKQLQANAAVASYAANKIIERIMR
jgi:hypothetical protein